MDKQNVVYTYNIILFSLKRKEILNIALSEISQSQKDNYCTIPVMWGTSSSQIQREKK